MYHLRDHASEQGYAASYISVADVVSERHFIARLYDAAHAMPAAKTVLAKIAKGPLGKLIRRIKKLGVPGFSVELADEAEDKWSQLGDALTRALNSLEQRWLFLIDELPIFILHLLKSDDSAQRARIFLNWFRQLRHDASGAHRVRWLLAGSIGLDTVTRRKNLGDTINDLRIR